VEDNIITVLSNVRDIVDRKRIVIQTLGEKKRTWNRFIMDEYLMCEDPVAHEEVKE